MRVRGQWVWRISPWSLLAIALGAAALACSLHERIPPDQRSGRVWEPAQGEAASPVRVEQWTAVRLSRPRRLRPALAPPRLIQRLNAKTAPSALVVPAAYSTDANETESRRCEIAIKSENLSPPELLPVLSPAGFADAVGTTAEATGEPCATLETIAPELELLSRDDNAVIRLSSYDCEPTRDGAALLAPALRSLAASAPREDAAVAVAFAEAASPVSEEVDAPAILPFTPDADSLSMILPWAPRADAVRERPAPPMPSARIAVQASQPSSPAASPLPSIEVAMRSKAKALHAAPPRLSIVAETPAGPMLRVKP